MKYKPDNKWIKKNKEEENYISERNEIRAKKAQFQKFLNNTHPFLFYVYNTLNSNDKKLLFNGVVNSLYFSDRLHKNCSINSVLLALENYSYCSHSEGISLKRKYLINKLI